MLILYNKKKILWDRDSTTDYFNNFLWEKKIDWIRCLQMMGCIHFFMKHREIKAQFANKSETENDFIKKEVILSE